MILDNIKNFVRSTSDVIEHVASDFARTRTIFILLLGLIPLWVLLYLSCDFVIIAVSLLLTVVMFVFWFLFFSKLERICIALSYFSICLSLALFSLGLNEIKADYTLQILMYIVLVGICGAHFLLIRKNIKNNHYQNVKNGLSASSVGFSLGPTFVSIFLARSLSQNLAKDVMNYLMFFITSFIAYVFIPFSIRYIMVFYYLRKYKTVFIEKSKTE